MRKENLEIPNKSSPDPLELYDSRARANDEFETENPVALKLALHMLRIDVADLEIIKQGDSEQATVINKATKEEVFMTREPSEIALLKNPVAGLQFLDNLNSSEDN